MRDRPQSSSAEVSARMRRAKTAGTRPELSLRRLLHREGLRYRVQYRIKGLPRRTIDIAFPKARLALFIDGCFWHGCTLHRTIPKSNNEWWTLKLVGNQARDRDTDERLGRLGWRVLRFWEHEDLEHMIDAVRSALAESHSPPGRDQIPEG
jgi:DNA mismatch endonuclease (patch repair protein)